MASEIDQMVRTTIKEACGEK